MSQLHGPSSRQIRDEVGHPIIDADGHLLEFSTCLRDRILETALEVGGPVLARKVEATNLTWDEDRLNAWARLSDDTRRDEWAPCMAWWGTPTIAVDRASAHLPALLYERLDELGIDFSVLFPSGASAFPSVRDDDVRPSPAGPSTP